MAIRANDVDRQLISIRPMTTHVLDTTVSRTLRDTRRSIRLRLSTPVRGQMNSAMAMRLYAWNTPRLGIEIACRPMLGVGSA